MTDAQEQIGRRPDLPAIWVRLPALFGGPPGCAGGVLVLFVVICATVAPLIAPYSPIAVDLRHQLVPPDAQFWFGTDQAGRDVLSRVIWGARPSLQVGMVAVVIGTIGGVALGLVAGFHSG